MATYVVSDLHGQIDIFKELLKRIDFSEKDYMYVLGDAIDRGPHGIELLQMIKSASNMDLLLGNHEHMMLNSVAKDGSVDDLPGPDADLWFDMNGGDITFEAYSKLPIAERVDLLQWLRTRKVLTLVNVNNKKYCLSHSYYKEDMIDVPYEERTPIKSFSVVWCSPFRFDTYKPISDYNIPDTTFIIGHVPVQRVVEMMDDGIEAYKEANVVLIDGGCAFSVNPNRDKDTYGAICLRLDDMEENVIYMSDVE